MIKFRYCLLLPLFLLAQYNMLCAQERLVGLDENILVAKQKNSRKNTLLKAAPLALPFVDDFAKATNYAPDPDKWRDNYVFVSNSYAVNPPTVGAATFDAFDHQGNLYKNSTIGSTVFAADTLTSQPIILTYFPSDSLYLSFFYQPGGYGDMPETSDTLVLQCYTSGNEWVNVWSASVNAKDSTITIKQGGKVKSKTRVHNLGNEFYQAHLKIDDPRFFHAGFSFRFINYVSIAVNASAPGRSTSADHWHLDYVYLDKNRSYNNLLLPDIGVAAPQHPFGTIYESVPATHLSSQDAINELFPDPTTLMVTYRNLGWGTKSVTRNFSIMPLYGVASTVQYNGGSENIFDGQTIDFEYQIPQYTITAPDDSAAFEIRSYLTTDNDPLPLRTALRYNDTVSYTQYFRNYYAYDDGTAENGYGLFGNGAAGGRVAMRFQSYKTDSIRGVYMYFNRTVNDASASSLYLTVWSDYNGKPDAVLYSVKVEKPEYVDSLNAYIAYKFPKAIEVAKNTPYYVGWIQTNDGFLNIGFDRNRNHRNKNFYYLNGEWQQSIYEGSVMLRPIFCRTDADFPQGAVIITPTPTDPEEKAAKEDFIVYPNPVSDGRLHIANHIAPHAILDADRVEIFDLNGRIILTGKPADGAVDVSTLSSGIYILRVWRGNTTIGSKRIVVTR